MPCEVLAAVRPQECSLSLFQNDMTDQLSGLAFMPRLLQKAPGTHSVCNSTMPHCLLLQALIGSTTL